MTASSIAVDCRGALKTALASVTANVYDHVPESPIVPAVVIVPDSPYLEPEILGSGIHLKINLAISCLVAYMSNPASLDNLEKLVVSVLSSLPSGYAVSAVERPSVTQVGSSNMLVADVRVSTYYTQTN